MLGGGASRGPCPGTLKGSLLRQERLWSSLGGSERTFALDEDLADVEDHAAGVAEVVLVVVNLGLVQVRVPGVVQHGAQVAGGKELTIRNGRRRHRQTADAQTGTAHSVRAWHWGV